mmetsp:Transcript_12027/g.30284  ORF Transcript_12027/g.30284 Transcript_12027/m.30284 type:complete len:255 (+) Transcript_12027:510-1274(+)
MHDERQAHRSLFDEAPVFVIPPHDVQRLWPEWHRQLRARDDAFDNLRYPHRNGPTGLSHSFAGLDTVRNAHVSAAGQIHQERLSRDRGCDLRAEPVVRRALGLAAHRLADVCSPGLRVAELVEHQPHLGRCHMSSGLGDHSLRASLPHSFEGVASHVLWHATAPLGGTPSGPLPRQAQRRHRGPRRDEAHDGREGGDHGAGRERRRELRAAGARDGTTLGARLGLGGAGGAAGAHARPAAHRGVSRPGVPPHGL